MYISSLYSYPIKSCGRLAHSALELDARGPAWDRRWMIVDSDGQFLTQREHPRMALIQPAFHGGELSITAPGMTELCISLEADRMIVCQVQVWNDVCKAWDEGQQAASWLSDYLKTDVRLVRMADDFQRPVSPYFARRPAHTGFVDGFPLLIALQKSLDELNQRLIERGAEALPMTRFRPNIVVEGGSAFGEDQWRTIRIGEVTLDVVKPCARCAITTVDQASGTIPDSAEPLATLNTFRKQNGKVMFAQNAIHHAPGVLQVGDEVQILEFSEAARALP